MKSGYHHGDLRSALIETGLKLLAERTADDVSLREMAREVGVSATAVYRHFPDKGALMSALAQEGLARLAVVQRQAADAAGGGAAGFAATGRAYVRFAMTNPALFRLIFSSPAPVDLLQRGAKESADAITFLKANAEAQLGPSADEQAVQVGALQAWSQAHGLAMLMLDGQIPARDELIDLVLAKPQ
ncbi:TetR/AcrR family transcriptional regulator [Caulobacter sp. S45]|uniref:TetR/AcrR family transcriptional regulator n=1 Tax=Caulobacter sp. S45 TaxID=1641861 RepID=UPI001576F848|nr:TetR/AcrR family transcriptional regulator [Caulobacter sp. S45]